MERKTIAELQHEYLTKLIACGGLTVGRASYRLSLFNDYRARLVLNGKGIK